MTDSSDTPNIEEWVDRIILDLVHKGSFMQKGKTINADMFPEAKQALLAKFQEVDETARTDELRHIHCCDNEPIAGYGDDSIDVCREGHVKRIEELTNKSNRTTL